MKPLELYQKHLPNLKKAHANEWRTNCPFHDEKTPSFFVNGETGQYYCFGCGVSGNIYTFLAHIGAGEEKAGLERDEYIKSISLVNNEPISPIIVNQLHRNLTNDISKLTYVLRNRRISFYVVKKYQLGYDPESDRYAFPITSKSGTYVNIKLHDSSKTPKSISWKAGYGASRLFPFSATLKSEIVICEGEFDCMLLHSLGINAITATAGAKSWMEEWGWFFVGKRIKLCLDTDSAGIEASRQIAEMLKPYTPYVKTILLPSEKDVSDYVRAGGDVYRALGIKRSQ